MMFDHFFVAFRAFFVACVMLCGILHETYAQDAVASQFMFDALSVNPGSTGINEYYKATAGYRNQWPLLGSAYVSYFASYDQRIESINSGLGLQVFRDVDGGVYSRTSAELYYAYQFKVGRHILISPGLQLAVAQRKLDAASLTMPDQNPYTGAGGVTEALSDKSAVFPDFGFGVVANISDRYTMGIAAHHLNAPMETLSEINAKRTPMSLSAHFISYFPLHFGKFDSRKMVFSPGFYFKQQQYQNLFSLGFNVAYDPVFIGFWTRAASLNPESIIFMVGLEQINYRIVYNYDYKFASVKGDFPNSGAHEITFVLKFHPKKKMRTIKCSKYSLIRK